MLDQNDLQAIAQLMDMKLQPINKRLDSVDARLDSIDERLSNVEEDSKVTRSAVNTLLDWAEQAQLEVKIPLYKKAE
ncbi:MAG: hypothetical protein ACLUNG_08980 [[Clostridium] leptum]